MKNKRNKEFFIISVTIFLTVIIWIIADIYHIQKTQKVKSIDPKILKNLDFEIPQEVFQILEEKR